MAHPIATRFAAKALLETDQSIRSVARQLKVAPNSVNKWSRDPRYSILPPEQVDQIKRSLLGNAYKNAHRIQSGITDDKIEKATLQQTAVSFAVFVDKARLMENLSTENISYGGVIQNIDNDRQKIMDRINSIAGDKK